MKKRKIIPYNPRLKELARQLRNNLTKSEIYLWLQLKGKQMLGYDFHRQKPIDEFIVDFYCSELFLAIEVDGYSHTIPEVIDKDEIKDKRLTQLGVTVLHIDDTEIFENMENVLLQIEDTIKKLEKTLLKKHTPKPPAKAGKALSRGE